jgi:uncharacterized protein DUF6370
MRTMIASITLLAAAVVFLAANGQAQEKKATTLTGKITCAKCDLGVEAKCATVIVTKIDGKDATVYFDAASHKKFHGDTCNDPKEGSVTGVVTKTGDKTTIAATTVKYAK